MRRRQFWILTRLLVTAALLSPVLASAPALANDPPSGGNAAHGDAHGDAGKPALLNFDPGTAVWSIIIFGVLLVTLRKTAWTPILAGLQQRERFIEDSLAQAKRERAESEKLLKHYTEQIDHARMEATAIVEEGKRDAEAVRKRIHEEAKAEAQAMLQRAKREIGIARDDAVKDLYTQSVGLATQMASKLVQKQLTPQDQQALIDEALTEIGNLRH